MNRAKILLQLLRNLDFLPKSQPVGIFDIVQRFDVADSAVVFLGEVPEVVSRPDGIVNVFGSAITGGGS